jgi:hypothetical protein
VLNGHKSSRTSAHNNLADLPLQRQSCVDNNLKQAKIKIGHDYKAQVDNAGMIFPGIDKVAHGYLMWMWGFRLTATDEDVTDAKVRKPALVVCASPIECIPKKRRGSRKLCRRIWIF